MMHAAHSGSSPDNHFSELSRAISVGAKTWVRGARGTGRVPAFLPRSRRGASTVPGRGGIVVPRQRCRSRAGMQAGAASVPLLQVSARAVRARGASASSTTSTPGTMDVEKPAAAAGCAPADRDPSGVACRCRLASNPSAVPSARASAWIA